MKKLDTTVGALVQMVESGQLKLPEMQRGYVWTAPRVRDLLDSLYRGYPSGSILVWETDAAPALRDGALDAPPSPFVSQQLLLDGQQRLTSLTAILTGRKVNVRGRKKPIEVLFNLDHPEGVEEVEEVDEDAVASDEEEAGDEFMERLRRRTFVVATSRLRASPAWVSVTEVLLGEKDDWDFLEPLVDSPRDPRYRLYGQRLQRLRRIKDYPYVMHILPRSLSYEEVTEIFVRVNSKGVKLRSSDLALAQITSKWPGSLATFQGYADHLSVLYPVDIAVLVRATVAMVTGQTQFKTVGSLSVTSLKDGWERAQRGLDFAVNFLTGNLHIDHPALLSSPFFLVALAGFYETSGGRVTEEEIRLLERWILLASGRGHYSRGSTETFLDSDLKDLREGRGSATLLRRLESQIGSLDVSAADLENRNWRNPLFMTCFLAMRRLGARDWQTNLAIGLNQAGKTHAIEYHHLHPKATLKDLEIQQVNEIANFAFISAATNKWIGKRPPSEYLPRILEQQGSKFLREHLIPEDPLLWQTDHYLDFLAARRQLLASAIQHLIIR